MTTSSINYTLTRSKRKSIGIYIREGAVEVRAPSKCPQSEIDRVIRSKENWIVDKIAISKRATEKRDNFELHYGSTILFRGQGYPITPKDGSTVGFDGKQFILPPNLNADQIKSACVSLYRHLAKAYLTERTLKYAASMGLTPITINITSAKTRWGSCSSKKSINFSWRLIMAEDKVIDYVVVHELAHLAQLNHSHKFWSIVQSILPDYEERKRCLRDLQTRLSHENW